MRKYPRFLFWGIVLLSVFAILIDLPKTISINFDTKIPVINQKISIHQNFQGFDPNIVFRVFNVRRDFAFKKGLDLEGGTSITLKADMRGVPADQKKDALDTAKQVVERRVNLFGVSEPIVQTATANNEYRIIVELPGVTDVNEAVNLIGTTAQLTFWEAGASGSAQMASSSALPLGLTQIIGPNPHKTSLTGNDLQQTTVGFDRNAGQPEVQLSFSDKGAKKFADITKRNLGKPVVIVLDNQIISYPRVNSVIANGDAVISGGFTAEQAKALRTQLQAGALPIPLAVIQQTTIGPTLGESSLEKSLFAGILGFIVIVIFMIALYGRLGVIASFALFLYILFVLAIFKLIPVTMTLAGIAGFILSIGMAVDANILIFERMKEELKSGKKKEIALELGFVRAWSSIRDSNISTLITSAILFQFGTGIIRGFAVTLAIGVIVSMFSAIVVTRTFLRMVYR